MQRFESWLVSVVIVMWDSADTLGECLRSLRGQRYQDVELIVVDNASVDESLAVAADYFPSATVLKNETNTGFCRGQNSGISRSLGEFVMPLNPDVQMEPDFIANLVQAMRQDKSIGIATGKLCLPDSHDESGARMLDSTGMFADRARRQYLRGHGEPDVGQFDIGGFVFGACGAAPLYRRAMLEDTRVNGEYFDTSFFAHKEDYDLAWRAQLQGWKAWYEPTAVAYHDRSFRPGRREVMSEQIKMHAVKNRYLVMLKNELLRNFMRDARMIVAYDVKIAAFVAIFERGSLPGFVHFLRLVPQTLRKRRIIMQRRRVDANYIRSVMH